MKITVGSSRASAAPFLPSQEEKTEGEPKASSVIRFRAVVLTFIVRIQFSTFVNWNVEPDLVDFPVPTIRLAVVVELCLAVWCAGIFMNSKAPLQDIASSISPGELTLYDAQICPIAIAKLHPCRQWKARGYLHNSAFLCFGAHTRPFDF